MHRLPGLRARLPLPSRSLPAEEVAQVRGVSDASDITATYDPESRQVRIVAKGSRRYDMAARLPDTAVSPAVKYIQYLNGIARIRLTK